MDKLADISSFESLCTSGCPSADFVFNDKKSFIGSIVDKIAPYKEDDQTWGNYLREHWRYPLYRLLGGSIGGLAFSGFGGLLGEALGSGAHGIATHPLSFIADVATRFPMGRSRLPLGLAVHDMRRYISSDDEIASDFAFGLPVGVLGALGSFPIGVYVGASAGQDIGMKAEIKRYKKRRARGEALNPKIARKLERIDRIDADYDAGLINDFLRDSAYGRVWLEGKYYKQKSKTVALNDVE